MKVHRTLGYGFFEIIYKDAIEIEIKLAEIQYEIEKEYCINYNCSLITFEYLCRQGIQRVVCP